MYLYHVIPSFASNSSIFHPRVPLKLLTSSKILIVTYILYLYFIHYCVHVHVFRADHARLYKLSGPMYLQN